MKNEKFNSLLLLTASMSIFGTIGIFVKYIPLASGFIAMVRGFVGAAFLALLMLLKRKKVDICAIKSNIILLIISGALIGLNWMLLFESYNYTSVAVSTLCYYLAPIFVIMASPIFLSERITPKKLISIGIALVGIVFISGFPINISKKKDIVGILFSTGAAIIYASVIILNKKIKGISAYDKTSVQLFSAATVILPYTLAFERISPSEFSSKTILLLLTVGVIHTGIAYAMYFGSMDNLKGQTVALFSYIDPVLAVVLSAIILGEDIGTLGYIGAVLILGAAIICELPEKQP